MIKRSTPEIGGLPPSVLSENNMASLVGVGNLYFASGLVSCQSGDMAAQLGDIRRQLVALLATEGMTPANVVATTTYTTDMPALLEHGQVLFEAFSAGHPTSTYIEVKGLASPELLVEFVVTAAKV